MNESANTQQQKQFKILLIGDSCTDVYRFGTVDRISPEAPVPVFRFAYDQDKPGMGANVKENLEALGCFVVPMLGIPSKKTRYVDTRSKQHIMRADSDFQNVPLKFEDIPYELNNADAIVVSDYNKGYVSYNLVQQLRKAYNGPIFVDTKKHDLEKFEGCIIKINQHEYSLLTSKPTSNLVVTYGDKGVVWDDWAFGAVSVEVADVCGAGDTFLSALCYQYLNTNDMPSAIQFAIKASAITVQHLGNYSPKLEEIK